MKKVIFAVKRLYLFISEFVVFDDKRNYSIFKLRFLLLCTHKSVTRIYMIYIYVHISFYCKNNFFQWFKVF